MTSSLKITDDNIDQIRAEIEAFDVNQFCAETAKLEALLTARRLREPRPTILTRRGSAFTAEEVPPMSHDHPNGDSMRDLAELAVMSKFFGAAESAKAWHEADPTRVFVDPTTLPSVTRTYEADRQEGDVLVAVVQVSAILRRDADGELQPLISHGVTGSLPVCVALGLVVSHEMEKKLQRRNEEQDREFAAYPVCPGCGRRHPTTETH